METRRVEEGWSGWRKRRSLHSRDSAAEVLLRAACGDGANLWPSQDLDSRLRRFLARPRPWRPRRPQPRRAAQAESPGRGGTRVGAWGRAGGGDAEGAETRRRGGAGGRGAGPDWPARRSVAVYGGGAGPPLQNKGQAARGAAAGGCLAPGRGANGQTASRATPGPPEGRARAARAWAGWALRTGPRTAERP